eukprot:CAMPEP_0172478798 /NCGR_PEP_ID=MMETSP1066-20121228/2971_1 /TAXON_ID=671091 /ORGANISM="Coscinodiscus wailesii, Strain CCMP2513" /LENGTH=583 /DNA_ID=CAMNT_0013238663 /DNA_START=59 /DNA_END=1810 /DNA_ORIENTATION=+
MSGSPSLPTSFSSEEKKSLLKSVVIHQREEQPALPDGEAQPDEENAKYGSTTAMCNGGGATTTATSKKKQPVNPIKPARRTQTTFIQDAINFSEGSVPQSMVVAVVIGIVVGLVGALYFEIMVAGLELFWKTLPRQFVIGTWPESTYCLWIPLVGLSAAVCLGLCVIYLGDPGDLAYTVKCVHDKAYVGMDHVLPMAAASLFSIWSGASVGPEAPLIAIGAALGGYFSRRVFRQTRRNVIRKHTLMGMAGVLAAFFGCPLGGSLFALEINSRFGVEYFEHMIEAIFCGEVTMVVFRIATGLPIAQIWEFDLVLDEVEPRIVILGAIIGVLGAGIATLFAMFHWRVVEVFDWFNLLDNKYAVWRGSISAIGIAIIGMLIPHTMFWGEDEFQQIATMAPAKELENVFPTSGLINFEMTSWKSALIVGVCKMISISLALAGGYRGGFIFPFFAAGAGFGRALCFFFPSVPVPVACLCFAGAINVAITRGCLGTALILTFVSGEGNLIGPILFSCLASSCVTVYMPFIKTQIIRSDINESVYLLEDDHLNEDWTANRHHRHSMKRVAMDLEEIVDEPDPPGSPFVRT